MPALGITGGIAAGKSLFTRHLVAALPGLALFDADAMARRLADSDPAARAAIREQFGPGVFDETGALQRDVLRGIVFADPSRRKALEAILHPPIRQAWTSLAKAARNPGEWFAADIPLLYETGAEGEFDCVIVVACSRETQQARLMDRRGLTAALADEMIASQMPLPEKIARATHVVWNDGDPAALETQARLLAARLPP